MEQSSRTLLYVASQLGKPYKARFAPSDGSLPANHDALQSELGAERRGLGLNSCTRSDTALRFVDRATTMRWGQRVPYVRARERALPEVSPKSLSKRASYFQLVAPI